jgi:hypothetical protein
LLEYFKLHKDTEILLLFQLLRALCGRFVADFQVTILRLGRKFFGSVPPLKTALLEKNKTEGEKIPDNYLS